MGHDLNVSALEHTWREQLNLLLIKLFYVSARNRGIFLKNYQKLRIIL